MCKITSKFDSLTADEWKNWTLLFSVICLYDILPAVDLDCCCLFVSACKIYCSSVLTISDFNTAHGLMRRFLSQLSHCMVPNF